MKNLKTKIFNDTHDAFNIRFWPGGIDQPVLLPMMLVVVDTPKIDTPKIDTYQLCEFFLPGESSFSNVVLRIGCADLQHAEEIRIYELLDCRISFRVSKLHHQKLIPLYGNQFQEYELAQFDAAKKNALTSMKSIEGLGTNMEELLKQIIVFHSQCDNLVRIFLKGIQGVRNILPDFEDENLMWTLYRRGNLRHLISSLDSLLRALMSAEQLLQACSGNEWKRVALVLSVAPPELEKYSGSRFLLLIRDFNWRLDIIRYLTEAPQRIEELKFKWIDHRCRYVLQRNIHASELTIGVTTDEDELHEDNVDEQASERKDEIRVSTDAVELHEDDVDQQAFDCMDEIGVAADEEELLKGDFERQALDRKDLLVNIEKRLTIHTHGNPFLHLAWQLCGNKFVADETSNNKFSEVVKNKCQDTSGLCSRNSVLECFRIDYLELKIKKLISGGSHKRIYSANWLGQEVAVAVIQYIPRDVVEKEAGFLVKLHHPNVVDFFGFALKEEALTEEEKNAVEQIEPKWTGYLVMELMQEDLRSLIDKLSRGPGMQESGGPFSLSIILKYQTKLNTRDAKHNTP